MCVAMIALSRCLSLTKPEMSEKVFGGINGRLIIAGVWIYANLLLIPIYTGVSHIVITGSELQ